MTIRQTWLLVSLSLCVSGALAETYREAFDRRTGLSGSEYWAGLKRHPAVVNPVGRAASPDVMSLAGEWEFTTFSHGSGKRTVFLQEKAEWPRVRKIRVPGCWQAQGVGGEGMSVPYLCQDSSPKRIRGSFVGEGWYRRAFDIPAAWAGKRIWLKVGRVGSQGWFYVNGRAVALHDQSVGAAKYDVTSFVKPGERATIVAVADNGVCARSSCSFLCRWGGILRDLELEATPQTYLDDVWVRGNFDSRLAEVHVEVGGLEGAGGVTAFRGRDALADRGGYFGLKLRVTVENETVELAARAGENVVRVPLADFRPWSPEHPNLYWADVALVDGARTLMTWRERFGVRKLEVRGKAFYLNGRPYYLRGFGDNYTHPLSGATPVDRAYHLAHLKTARAAGFNYVRLHTHPENEEYFEAADEAGILVQPELGYYLDNPNDYFDWDLLKDAEVRHRAFRRYVSYAIQSCGNEGAVGPAAGRYVYDFLKELDPDRLVIEEDGASHYAPHHAEGRADFASGPLSTWPRGTFDPRCFVAHEFLNLAVKADCRDAADYTGTWLPPLTREERRAHLASAGLSDAWLDRLQDAQHALQAYWQKNGVEHVRNDPYCDGYCFWTICDTTVFNEKAGIFTAQGLFNPFWRTKRHGTSPAAAAVFNSSSCVLIDTEDLVRPQVFDHSETGIYFKVVHEETNRVYQVGETIPVEFRFVHFGERPVADAELQWSFVAPDGRVLASETFGVGTQVVGPVRSLGRRRIAVPAVARPTKVRFEVAVRTKDRSFEQANAWDFWFFPAADDMPVPENVVVAGWGTPAAEAAYASGKNVLTLANQTGKPNFILGWWNIGTQVGMAAVEHPVLGDFPFEPYLCPLLFRIVHEGTKLPLAGFTEKDLVIVGEGLKEAYAYLAVRDLPNGRKHVFVSGLDLGSRTVEGCALRRAILKYLGGSK